MSLIVATLLSLAAQAAPIDAGNLPGVFAATCLDGQARLSAGEVNPISFDQLPEGLRSSLGRPASAKVWQLRTAGRSFLYLLEYPSRPGLSPKVCGLASDSMSLKTASDALEMRVTGSVEPNKPRSTQWVNAKDGYTATATTASSFNVLQVSWMRLPQ